MPGMRKPGMDNDFYDWSPIINRPPLRWPEDARVALCVIVNLEHYELEAPEDAYMPANVPGGLGRGAFPDFRTFSHREYGNRVGIFRIMKILEKYGIKGTLALDATAAENYPFVIEECQKRDWEFIGHGVTANRMITSNMSEEQEYQYIHHSMQAIAKATGKRPLGWLGPEYGESTRTPNLLAKEGIRYICDWPNDEQPYLMKVDNGTVFSLPVTLDLDDTVTHWSRRVSIMEYSRMIKESFDVLYTDGEATGRTLVLNLHAWLMGQPYRAKYLDHVLAYISKHQKVWKATGSEIIDWFSGQLSRG